MGIQPVGFAPGDLAGHPVIVANARKLRTISPILTKSDREDAQMLSPWITPIRSCFGGSSPSYRRGVPVGAEWVLVGIVSSNGRDGA